MPDTGIDHRRLVLKNRASGYGTYKGEFTHAQYIDLSQVYSAGSIYSTVNDLLKWDNALYTEKVLPQKSLERMWTPVKDNYGYGWLRVKLLGKTCIVHNGGLPGFQCTVSRFPDQKVFVPVLCNLEGSQLGRVSRDLTAIALGQPYDLPIARTEAKIDLKLLDAYVGEYEIKPMQVLTVTKDGDRLYARMTGQGRFPLVPESDTKFFARAEEATVAFFKDDKGVVSRLVLHQNGADIGAKRVQRPPAEPKKE
jgi:D-alanyl-D-alanine carboxypeptidase